MKTACALDPTRLQSKSHLLKGRGKRSTCTLVTLLLPEAETVYYGGMDRESSSPPVTGKGQQSAGREQKIHSRPGFCTTTKQKHPAAEGSAGNLLTPKAPHGCKAKFGCHRVWGTRGAGVGRKQEALRSSRPGVSKPEPAGQIRPTTCFYK